MRLHSLVLSFFAVGIAAQAGVFTCPDQTYGIVPISGVTGGVATSCGNASVDALGGLVATPGNGTVLPPELEAYLGLSLVPAAPLGYEVIEGSAVQFAGFTAGAGATLSFTWESLFEEGGTGSLFYVLNGGLTVLDGILPNGQSLPGDSNKGTVTVGLLEGVNTFAFGAVSLGNSSNPFPTEAFDPQLAISNMSVSTSNGVPEPGSFALMGAGLAGLVAWMRRRS